MYFVNMTALLIGYFVLALLVPVITWIFFQVGQSARHALDFQRWIIAAKKQRNDPVKLRGFTLLRARVKDLAVNTWKFLGEDFQSTKIVLDFKDKTEEYDVRPIMWAGYGNWILFDGTKGANWNPDNRW